MNNKTIIALLILAANPIQALAIDYIIEKGNHYSNTTDLPSTFEGSSLKFKAMFDQSAIYDLGNENQWDVNNLYGTTDCGSWTPTKNSARFGWAWNLKTKKLDIYAFTHKNGKFDFLQIDTAELNQVFDFEIKLSEDHSQYIYTFKGKSVTMDRGCSDSEMDGFKLKPYFGGNEVAPHEVLIKIEDADDYATASIQNVYPNPTFGNDLLVDLNLPETAAVGFRIYDLTGKLVKEITPQELPANPLLKGYAIDLNSLPGGVFLIRPFVQKNGELIPGFVYGEGRAKKIVIVK
jgi:hypothetical protein